MKNIVKKFVWSLFVLLFGVVSILEVSAVKVYLPDWNWQEDINIDNPQVNTNEKTLFEYIQLINSYLWFSIAWIAMAILVYAWIQLITAWWDKSKVSKAGKLAFSCLIAIVVAMLSYLLVNLIINLF